MTSSDRFKGLPPSLQPLGARSLSLDEPARAPNAYARFIPREEVGQVTAWQPGSFSGPERRVGDRRAGGAAAKGPGAGAPAPAPAPAPDEVERARQLAQAVEAARQGGYRDGYRDGLVALENFKQSYAQQVSAQVASVVAACQAQLDALQQSIADTVAHTATALARQVVRHELATRPELVAAVAREAVEALIESAQHLTLRVHPDDAALVAAGAGDALAARRVRLVADATVERGGCQLDADIARLDAGLATRWQRAIGALGVATPWALAPEAAVEVQPEATQAAAASPAELAADATAMSPAPAGERP